MHPAEVYADVRRSLTALLRTITDEQAAAPVAACPGWTVKDCVAHLAAVATDVLAGRVEGAGTDAWTGRQIAERQHQTMAGVLDEWDEAGPRLEEVLAGAGEASAPILAADAATHEHDVLAALGRSDRRDSPGVEHGLQVGIGALHHRLTRDGVPALRIVSGDDEWIAGAGEPAATVAADRYDVFRALIGRRSRAQITAFAWDGDPAPYLGAFSLFPPPEADLDELARL